MQFLKLARVSVILSINSYNTITMWVRHAQYNVGERGGSNTGSRCLFVISYVTRLKDYALIMYLCFQVIRVRVSLSTLNVITSKC